MAQGSKPQFHLTAKLDFNRLTHLNQVQKALMKIASFVGQKGGVGKSTLARVLAVKAAHEGHRVLLGDFDLEQLS